MIGRIFRAVFSFCYKIAEKIVEFVKRYWMMFAIVIATSQMYGGDFTQFKLQLYVLSTVVMVLASAKLLLDDRKGWGLFSFIHLEDLYEKAKESAMGAAIVFASFIYLLATIIQVAVIRN